MPVVCARGHVPLLSGALSTAGAQPPGHAGPPAHSGAPDHAGPPDHAGQGQGKGLAKGKGLKGLVDLGEPHFSPARTPAHEDIPEGGIGRNFKLIDHNPLIETGGILPRGGGGNSINIVRNCAYAATKSQDQGIMILDISNPHNIEVVKEMEPVASPPSGNRLQTDHVATVESENLLVQVSENGRPPYDGNFIELFDTTNCFNPVKVGHIDLPDTPHDLNTLWMGGDPHTVLLFVVFNDRRDDPTGTGIPPPPADTDLRIYDITNKFNRSDRSPSGPCRRSTEYRSRERATPRERRVPL